MEYTEKEAIQKTTGGSVRNPNKSNHLGEALRRKEPPKIDRLATDWIDADTVVHEIIIALVNAIDNTVLIAVGPSGPVFMTHRLIFNSPNTCFSLKEMVTGCTFAAMA